MTRFSNYRIAFGAVLVAAFVSAAGMLLQAEPPQAVGTWASIGATPENRVGATAVTLPDGRTLIAGGSINNAPTDTVVIFNPADGSFESVGFLLAARVGHSATLLEDGRVLIVGGTVAGILRNDLELFDPSSEASVPSATMPQPRSGHAAARLADGKVLIVGGTTTAGVVLQTAEIYDPSADTTTPTTLPMLIPRTGASATTLIDGRVLIAGGSSNGSVDLMSAEIYQPWSQLFESVETGMSVARSGHAAVLLPWNNSVLIAGGSSDGVPQLTSDLFLPAEFPDPYWYGIGHFGPTGSMAAPRVHATAAPHIEGYAVAMGGGAADAEVYRFATVKTDKDDYEPGERALITGSGWEPNSELTLLFQEDPAVHDDYVLPNVPTDSEGNFTWDQWAPEEHDLNVRFYLTAKQTTLEGERRAQTTFTDARTINSVTLNGGSSVSVSPSASITTVINVTTDGSGANSRWRSTGWLIGTTAPGTVTCVNHANHDAAGGPFPETFSITAPTTAGTYNAYFIAYNDDTCGGGASTTFTLTNGVIVNPGTLNAFAVTNTSDGNIAPQTAGTPFNIKVRAVDAFSNTVTSFSGGSNKVTISSTGTLSAGSGATVNFSLGVLASHSVTISNTGTFTIMATNHPSGPETGTSNSFLVNAPACTVPAITTQPSVQTVTYGAASASFSAAASGNPTPTVQWQVSVGGGPFSNIGGATNTTYAISNPTVSLSGNQYRAVFTNTCGGTQTATTNPASLTVTPKAASVTPNAANKEYGAADPAFTGTLSGFLAGDSVTAAYSRTAGQTVVGSPYTISAVLSPAGVLSNYTITYNTASFTITTKAASVTPNAANKEYGAADPAFTGTLSGFLAADGVTAVYSRTAGETVVGSPYTTSAVLSPAGVLSNYAITYNTASFTITTKAASVTPAVAMKEYGAADPALTGVLSGFLAGDGVTAVYSRTAGETVGGSPYTTSAVLSPAGVLGNYAITYNTASFTITTKAASVTPDAATKEYGAGDPALTGTLSGFLAADGVTASYSRTAGETVVGSPYTTSAVLSPAGVLSNYAITYNTANFTITTKAASVTPDAATKEYGAGDPALTGTLSGFLAADGVTASYSRTAGETVVGSPYTTSAALSPAGVLSNYAITYNTADFTITGRPATWTTAANSKTYGDSDPAGLTTGSGDFLAADNVTASYSRAAGETVLGGPYHITATLAPTAVLSNYIVTNAGADFTINGRPATWTTTANSKGYGDAEPSPLTTGSGDFLAADGVTASYSRVAGETVLGGPYHISATLSPAGVLSNYSITNVGASFTINTRPATWTTTANSKGYGDAEPSPLTTGSGDFLAADGVTASYSRAAGETVLGGPYHISAMLSPAAVLSNYSITNVGASFTINTRPATWTTTANSKGYGDAEPSPLTTGSGDFLAADGVTASYSRAAGETVLGGPYHISAMLSPAAVLSNYSITNVGASFTINTRPATWTTTANSKGYGDAEPSPLTTGSGDFLAADGVTASYSRVAGETVLGGPYHISATLSPAGVLSNYSITNVGASFTINTRPATWTTTANSKGYGDAEPSPLTTGSGDFLAADGVTASYSRVAGETVLGGPYAISATLSPAGVLSNYSITNVGASFTINTRPATWTTTANSKGYGDAEPSPLTTGSGDFLAADGVTASYSRAAGETVLGGPYHITATLAPGAVLSNYSITNVGASFTINTRPATWTTTANSKGYGDAEPSPLTTGSGDFLAADGVTASYSRAAGETVLGGPYHISAMLSPAAVLSNYSITNVGASFTINTRPATWTTTANSKGYGDAEPSPLTTGSGDFLAADGVTASYSRVAGETVLGGPYAITATLSPAAVLSNYSITNVGASFTINTRPATWTTAANSKVYGNSDLVPLTTGSGDFLAADGVTASYSRAAGETVLGGPYHISAMLSPAAVLSNYSITNVGASFTINTRPATWTTTANSKGYGDAEPSPLTTGSGDFLAADGVTASYSRAAGETVLGGPYHISAMLSPAAVLSNYSITNVGASFTINTRPATWTTTANSKVYGNSDLVPLTTGSGDFLAADGVTASYSRAAGETVLGGPYAISATLSPAAVLSNYSITNAGASFTINTRPATWTTTANSKGYGDSDPAPLTTGSGDFLVADGVTASYSRVAGETVLGGPYAITATLSPAAVLSNYSITNAGASFTINTRPATWTTAANSKVYGNSDLVPLTTGSGDFLAADGVTASYSRAAGETVLGGPYHITATLAPGAVLSNYSITNAGASFAINTRPATWTTAANSKVYGNSDLVPLTTGSGDFLAADGVTASYGRAAGETVLGGPYHITATLAPTAVLSNYIVTNAGANFTITVRPITVSAEAKTKVMGGVEPPLTYNVTSGSLVSGDSFSGSLTRTAGESIGSYPILQGTVAAGSNYSLGYVGANLNIVYATATCLGAPGHQILQPINVDGTSVFKQKSTVPAKFRVCDTNGVSVGTPGVVTSFSLVQVITGTAVETVNEPVDSTTPDLAFRWSATDQQWIFNINTKNQAANKTYVYRITLNDGSTIQFQFGLK